MSAIRRWISLAFAILIVLFLMLEVVDHLWLDIALKVGVIITIGLCFVLAKRTAQFLALLFLSTGITLLTITGVGWQGFINSFGEMVFVVAFFSILPIVALPIRVIGYDQQIMSIIVRQADTVKKEYGFILALSYFYGIFLNLAAVPMSFRSLQSLLMRKNVQNKERFLFYSMSQGFNAPLLWTPFSGMLGVIVVAFEVSWLTLLPTLLGVSFSALLLSFLLYWPWTKATQIESKLPVTPVSETQSGWPGLVELLLVVGILLLLVLILEFLFGLGLIISIIFLTFPFTFFWVALKGRIAAFKLSLFQYVGVQLPTMASIYMVFLSAGFFVGALQLSGYDALISQYVSHGLTVIPNFAVYALLPWVVIVTSYMGIHPIVTLVLLTGAIQWNSLGLQTELLAIAYLVGGVSTFLISPFSGTIGLMRSFTQRGYPAIIWPNLGTVLIFHGVVWVAIQARYWLGS